VQQARDAIARRADLGDAARLDVDLMDAELAQAAVAQTEHAAARQTTQLALGREFPGLPLPVRSPVLPEPEKLTGEVEAWVARIVEHDHALRAMREDVSRQDLTAQRARADRIPDPMLGVRVLDERDGAERSVGLVFSMPIGSGNRAARADAAMADARASRRDSEAMHRESELEARLTVTHATHAVNRWQAQYRAYGAMALAAARTRKAWELGETDLADRLLADRREREAAIDEQRMRADALKAALLVRLDSHELWAEPQ
jgi:outer membrane protein TolC